MYNMLRILVTFLDGISMLLCIHIGFRREFNSSKGKVWFVALYVLYFYLAGTYQISIFIDLVLALMVFLWSGIQFRYKLHQTVLDFIISILILGVTQTCILWLISTVVKGMDIDIKSIYLLADMCNVMVLWCVYKKLNKQNPKVGHIDIATIAVILYVVIIMLFIKYDYANRDGMFSDLYAVLFVSLLLFVLGAVRSLNVKYKLEQKQLQLELNEKYETAYEQLLLEMRRKQHDFRNQISAMYSMHLVAKDKDHLIEMQREYGNQLLMNDKFSNLITGCDNSVLMGYIYTQCVNADRKGISIEPCVICSAKDHSIPLYEIIEILGILINNAVEYLDINNEDNKEIKLNVYEEVEKINIEVANPAQYQSYDALTEMFVIGSSTKGKGRGIGLNSLKALVNKYKGDLLVENIFESGTNWLRIRITI